MVDYVSENHKEHRYNLVVIDNFSKEVWTVPLEIKSSGTKITDSQIFDSFRTETL